ncbi:5-methylcytosine-specific restriction protein A [Variovorax sp. GrIS 2.14]|uniref:HNH endonuclease n=1 Tax=Variovorax sp. GrIS 2.14 TaxID=3071709 RepID=UPI0038F66116
MAPGFDVDVVRRRLEGRFGLALESAHEEFDGGNFEVLRPLNLEKGIGFSLVLSRTHRQVEASFRADNFAGVMLRKMAEADIAAKVRFESIRERAQSVGIQVYTAINGTPIKSSADNIESIWRTAEVDAIKRLPSAYSSNLVLDSLVEVSYVCLSLTLSLLPEDELEIPTATHTDGLPEGALMRIEVNKYERSAVNRATCISHYGAVCQACGFDFSSFYGDVGEGYIEVHHRTPVAALGPNYVINPITDLIPVCSNCHSMLHRSNPPITVESLRSSVSGKAVMNCNKVG